MTVEEDVLQETPHSSLLLKDFIKKFLCFPPAPNPKLHFLVMRVIVCQNGGTHGLQNT